MHNDDARELSHKRKGETSGDMGSLSPKPSSTTAGSAPAPSGSTKTSLQGHLVFANVYRGDMITRTIHFYLLTPVRREVLVVGKYLGGLLITGSLYGASVGITNILIHSANGSAISQTHFFNGPGISELLSYVGIAVLACVGYGSVFMLTGYLFKNPAIPAAFVLLWESVNVFLPEALQKISVVHYLQSIVPVPIPLGPFAVITAPASVVTSVTGLALFTIAGLIVNGLLMRKTEINYTSD